MEESSSSSRRQPKTSKKRVYKKRDPKKVKEKVLSKRQKAKLAHNEFLLASFGKFADDDNAPSPIVEDVVAQYKKLDLTSERAPAVRIAPRYATVRENTVEVVSSPNVPPREIPAEKEANNEKEKEKVLLEKRKAELSRNEFLLASFGKFAYDNDAPSPIVEDVVAQYKQLDLTSERAPTVRSAPRYVIVRENTFEVVASPNVSPREIPAEKEAKKAKEVSSEESSEARPTPSFASVDSPMDDDEDISDFQQQLLAFISKGDTAAPVAVAPEQASSLVQNQTPAEESSEARPTPSFASADSPMDDDEDISDFQQQLLAFISKGDTAAPVAVTPEQASSLVQNPTPASSPVEPSVDYADNGNDSPPPASPLSFLEENVDQLTEQQLPADGQEFVIYVPSDSPDTLEERYEKREAALDVLFPPPMSTQIPPAIWYEKEVDLKEWASEGETRLQIFGQGEQEAQASAIRRQVLEKKEREERLAREMENSLLARDISLYDNDPVSEITLDLPGQVSYDSFRRGVPDNAASAALSPYLFPSEQLRYGNMSPASLEEEKDLSAYINSIVPFASSVLDEYIPGVSSYGMQEVADNIMDADMMEISTDASSPFTILPTSDSVMTPGIPKFPSLKRTRESDEAERQTQGSPRPTKKQKAAAHFLPFINIARKRKEKEALYENGLNFSFPWDVGQVEKEIANVDSELAVIDIELALRKMELEEASDPLLHLAFGNTDIYDAMAPFRSTPDALHLTETSMEGATDNALRLVAPLVVSAEVTDVNYERLVRDPNGFLDRYRRLTTLVLASVAWTSEVSAGVSSLPVLDTLVLRNMWPEGIIPAPGDSLTRLPILDTAPRTAWWKLPISGLQITRLTVIACSGFKGNEPYGSLPRLTHLRLEGMPEALPPCLATYSREIYRPPSLVIPKTVTAQETTAVVEQDPFIVESQYWDPDHPELDVNAHARRPGKVRTWKYFPAPSLQHIEARNCAAITSTGEIWPLLEGLKLSWDVQLASEYRPQGELSGFSIQALPRSTERVSVGIEGVVVPFTINSPAGGSGIQTEVRLPHVKAFDVTTFESIGDEETRWIITNAPLLEELRVPFIRLPNDSMLPIFWFRNLKRLSVGGHAYATLEMFLSAPMLVSVVMEKCPELFASFVAPDQRTREYAAEVLKAFMARPNEGDPVPERIGFTSPGAQGIWGSEEEEEAYRKGYSGIQVDPDDEEEGPYANGYSGFREIFDAQNDALHMRFVRLQDYHIEPLEVYGNRALAIPATEDEIFEDGFEDL